MKSFQLNLLGIEAPFRTDADVDTMEAARAMIEERALKLKSSGGLYSRDKLLVLVALGVAYDLLQIRHELDETENRISSMLKRIEESV